MNLSHPPSRSKRALLALSLALWVGALAPSCRPAAGGFCAKVCECAGCESGDRDVCIQTVQNAHDAADHKGCGGVFDAYVSCTKEGIECSLEGGSADCASEEAAVTACGASLSAPCDILTERVRYRLETCGVSAPDWGEACSADTAASLVCYLTCFEQSPCEALTGEDKDAQGRYVGCIATCLL